MCLILFAVRPTERHRLVVAANRDEFYGRPADRANWWADHGDVLAGRDIQAGGTWLGVTRTGRFAAVTNFREEPPDPIPPRSRGDLPSNFLTGDMSARDYVHGIADEGDEFRGFNLIVDDGRSCWYTCNRLPEPIELKPGYYGLSNQTLDCDWPKVGRGRDALKSIVADALAGDDLARTNQRMLSLLTDTGTGEPFSNSFINTAEYGTCASTLLTITTTGDVSFTEHGFGSHGKPESDVSYQFETRRN